MKKEYGRGIEWTIKDPSEMNIIPGVVLHNTLANIEKTKFKPIDVKLFFEVIEDYTYPSWIGRLTWYAVRDE